MRRVGRKTKKIIANFFLFTLILQGACVPLSSARADDSYDNYESTKFEAKRIQGQMDAKTNNSTNTEQAPTSGETADSCDTLNIYCWGKQLVAWILLQLRNFLITFVASPAAGAFAWVVDPANISGQNGVLNRPPIYQLWQFIRDFFNLFFILILLFSAFATIFQVDSFNIRNIFKNVLLVALLINFSFPITRFLIDATNVPMYYFINEVIGGGSGQGGQIAMNTLLARSGIGGGVLSNLNENSSLTLILTSIIFIFLFGISLAVLAMMMVIRLVALTLLLIFSPIGFAGSLIPGLGTYGREWWTKFWNYALFGPAAGLTLVVALKFMEVTSDGTTWQSMNAVATNNTPDESSAVTMVQIIMFTLPIILIWFAIGLASKFSMAGAATVVGLGMWAPNKIRDYGRRAIVNTAKFTGRTTLGAVKTTARAVLPVNYAKGTYAGVKEAVKGDGKLFGRQVIPKFMTGDAAQAREDKREARRRTTQGFVQGGSKGAADELRKLEAERVRKGVKEAQEKGKQATDHLKTLNTADSSTVEKRIAALSLAQQGEIRTAGQLADALDAVKGNVDEFNQVLDKAKPEAIGSIGSGENRRITTMLDDPVYGTRQRDLQESYNARLKKEGKVEYKVEAELARAQSVGPLSPDQISKIYANNLKMATKDLSKQSGIIQRASVNGNDQYARQYFQEMAANQKDSFEKLLGSDDLKSEDRAVLVEIKNSVGSQGPQRSQAWQNAQAAFNQPSGNTGQNNGGQQNP